MPVLLLAGCKNKKGQEVIEPAAPVAFQAPAVVSWAKNAVIYEVNIRQYTKEGTFNAFADHLPRLKELGVDILRGIFLAGCPTSPLAARKLSGAQR